MDDEPGPDVNMISQISFLFILNISILVIHVSIIFIRRLNNKKQDNVEKTEEKMIKEKIQCILDRRDEINDSNQSKKEMINGIIKFNDKRAEKIMTPRTEVYCINVDDLLEEYLDELLDKRYARIPVYEDEIDNIIGVLYIKDFIIEAKNKGFENINIRDILQEPLFIPECKMVQDLFKELQETKRHIAILVDEYGGFSGIVTMEDIIEEIMGEIDDEYDISQDGIKKLDNNKFLVDGITTLEEINNKLNIEMKSEDIETISGFLINILGRIPIEEDEKIVKYNNISFKIYEVTDKRIEKVMISL